PGEWDASLNGRIKDAKYWVKAGGRETPAAATLDEKEGVYRLGVSGSPTSIVGSVQYGVVSLAKNPPTLLRYTAKHLVGAASNWASEKPSPNLRIEALAKLDGDSLRITI